MSIFSSPEQLGATREILSKCLLLPFWDASIPGAVLESTIAHVRGGSVLRTYDFVDVINPETRTGWQVKSTKSNTPVTWKRAKLPDAQQLIASSNESEAGLQELGDTILGFCNEHARDSISKYELKEIGYCRLILHDDGSATFFERLLCTEESPDIFNPSEFSWEWSIPKLSTKKEQLPALHGTNRGTGEKCWAWHGLGENQLHFSGESAWWPDAGSPNSFSFLSPSPDNKLSFDAFVKILAGLDI